MLKIVVATMLFFLLAHDANASAVTVQSYLTEQNQDFRNFTDIWVDGVFNGFQSANADLLASGKRPLFCTPTKIAFTIDQIKSILDRYLKEHRFQGNFTVDIVLLSALKDVFPCR